MMYYHKLLSKGLGPHFPQHIFIYLVSAFASYLLVHILNDQYVLDSLFLKLVIVVFTYGIPFLDVWIKGSSFPAVSVLMQITWIFMIIGLVVYYYFLIRKTERIRRRFGRRPGLYFVNNFVLVSAIIAFVIYTDNFFELSRREGDLKAIGLLLIHHKTTFAVFYSIAYSSLAYLIAIVVYSGECVMSRSNMSNSLK